MDVVTDEPRPGRLEKAGAVSARSEAAGVSLPLAEGRNIGMLQRYRLGRMPKDSEVDEWGLPDAGSSLVEKLEQYPTQYQPIVRRSRVLRRGQSCRYCTWPAVAYVRPRHEGGREGLD